MPLVNMRDMLVHARGNHYAVGAFDIVSLELLQGVLRGAEACRAPVILNFVVPQFKYYDFEMLMAATVAGAQRSPVPVAIHLDHAADLDGIVRGIRLGCNGVMFDGSHLPFEENVKRTRAIVEVAHACGIPVEGEIGVVSSYAGEAETDGAPGMYTWPDEARQYVRQTKVDFLSVSIGTGHGLSDERSRLDLERLARISRVVDVPLVIHGGSGLSDAESKCLINRGVARINYYSALSLIASRRIRSNSLEDPNAGYMALLHGVSDAIGREVERCLRVWGAAQRADAVLAAAAPWNEVEHLIIYNLEGGTERQAEAMMAQGRRVLAQVPGVRRVFSGRSVREGDKYRYCWLVRFAHPKVIDSYRIHPEHVAFADDWFRPCAADRISIDYQAAESAFAEDAALEKDGKLKER
jgi:fructose-bisphosphate aldolase class II